MQTNEPLKLQRPIRQFMHKAEAASYGWGGLYSREDVLAHNVQNVLFSTSGMDRLLEFVVTGIARIELPFGIDNVILVPGVNRLCVEIPELAYRPVRTVDPDVTLQEVADWLRAVLLFEGLLGPTSDQGGGQ